MGAGGGGEAEVEVRFGEEGECGEGGWGGGLEDREGFCGEGEGFGWAACVEEGFGLC